MEDGCGQLVIMVTHGLADPGRQQHGMNFFDALVQLAEGHAWMPSAI